MMMIHVVSVLRSPPIVPSSFALSWLLVRLLRQSVVPRIPVVEFQLQQPPPLRLVSVVRCLLPSVVFPTPVVPFDVLRRRPFVPPRRLVVFVALLRRPSFVVAAVSQSLVVVSVFRPPWSLRVVWPLLRPVPVVVSFV